MKRELYNDLISWKNSSNRKPLLLQGARQTGKTYLVTQFAKNEYQDFVYLNFEQDPDLKTLFAGTLKAEKIIENISLYINKKIEPEYTLLFFDEVQIVPEVITSLKYFYEQSPNFHIIAAGSLLGVSVSSHKSFPVGKVNFLTLYPMNFYEYLLAFGKELLAEKLKNKTDAEALPELIHKELIELLKKFLFLGGMPEVLKTYLDTGDIELIRKIQNEILEAYQRDFSKYTTKREAVRISEVWRSIPYQLSRENKKFKFKDVKKGGRASTYEQTMEWLSKAGLINISYNLSVPKLPLQGYADLSKFKIYLLDTGLLGALLKLNSSIILKPNELFTEYNGAFIENFVASELISNKYKNLFYWTSKSDAEVDFIIEQNNKIYPLEVKSGMSRNIKSLRSYYEKYKPELLIRTSPRNFIRDEEFINIPLYAICSLKNIIKHS